MSFWLRSRLVMKLMTWFIRDVIGGVCIRGAWNGNSRQWGVGALDTVFFYISLIKLDASCSVAASERLTLETLRATHRDVCLD